MRPIQFFSEEYLRRCREMSPDQILQFLEDFRRLHGSKPAPSKLISLKVPIDLLRAFRTKAALVSTPYQTQSKALRTAWVREVSGKAQ